MTGLRMDEYNTKERDNNYQVLISPQYSGQFISVQIAKAVFNKNDTVTSWEQLISQMNSILCPSLREAGLDARVVDAVDLDGNHLWRGLDPRLTFKEVINYLKSSDWQFYIGRRNLLCCQTYSNCAGPILKLCYTICESC